VGGVRWTATFDGQADVSSNPWGLLPWSMVPAAAGGVPAAPRWGFSRMLAQKPLWMKMLGAPDAWTQSVVPYLRSEDPAAFNFERPATTDPGWGGAVIPSFVDCAADTAVVRLTGNPGGPFNGDHLTASIALGTGFVAGQVGLVTAMQAALRAQLGMAGFEARYPLPAVSIGTPFFALGSGQYAAHRPIVLGSVRALPTSDPGSSVAAWGHLAENDIDGALLARSPALLAQSVSNFVGDRTAGDLHVGQLVDPALRLADATASAAAKGTLLGGSDPVTNAMLAQAFGLSSAATAAGDPWFDVVGATENSGAATWDLPDNTWGLTGALAVRLFQLGAPVVSCALGNFDTHGTEIGDPTQSGISLLDKQVSHPVHAAALTRLLSGLAFALRRVADPGDPSGATSLWDTTVVLVCSEFGRASEAGDVGPNGFNSANGANYGGSGHGAWSAWPLLGGPIAAGGALLVDGANGGFFHQNRVFTTLMKAMGVEEANSPYLPYASFAPIAGLVRGV
jgi:hypothetical protein